MHIHANACLLTNTCESVAIQSVAWVTDTGITSPSVDTDLIAPVCVEHTLIDV